MHIKTVGVMIALVSTTLIRIVKLQGQKPLPGQADKACFPGCSVEGKFEPERTFDDYLTRKATGKPASITNNRVIQKLHIHIPTGLFAKGNRSLFCLGRIKPVIEKDKKQSQPE